MMQYRYVHTATEASTGYFSCEPHPPLALDKALTWLARHPLDDFMRRHSIALLSSLPGREIGEALLEAFPAGAFPPAITALAQELALLNPTLKDESALFSSLLQKKTHTVPPDSTSLVFLRWQTLPDHSQHAAWGRFFLDNTQNHRALAVPAASGLPPLYPAFAAGFGLLKGKTLFATLLGEAKLAGLPGLAPCFTDPFPVALADVHPLHQRRVPDVPAPPRTPAEETVAKAEERLSALDIIAGPEMRHTASLSPVALLRPWNVRVSVANGRNNLTLTGRATTYGRGLAVADARVSCLMEMVERASAYLSFESENVLGLARPTPLCFCSYSRLLQEQGEAISPNDFPVDVPYADEPLHWIRGHRPGQRAVFVPVQMVSLFCNLDEIALSDSPASTGLASGCTLEEAKLVALLEILERDAEATTPFVREDCFTLAPENNGDARLDALLHEYRTLGINVHFQDITSSLGVPVYKCFVMSLKGAIARGYGAGLSARRALTAALTETPFPFPDGGPSGPLLRRLPIRNLSDLPDFSLSTPAANLAMLEDLLIRCNREPVYVELTRPDLGFPVVRALVPGMQTAACGDVPTRVPARLYAKYLRLFTG